MNSFHLCITAAHVLSSAEINLFGSMEESMRVLVCLLNYYYKTRYLKGHYFVEMREEGEVHLACTFTTKEK